MKPGEFPRPTLCMTKGAALYAGSIIDTGAHSHHAIQIVLSARDKFQIRVGDNLSLTSAVLINSDVEHELFASGTYCIFFYAEPESTFGQMLKDKLQGDYEFFDDQKSLCADLVNACLHRPSVKEFRKMTERHWRLPEQKTPLDSRIYRALNLIEQVEFRKTKISGLAERTGISESRLQHLFKEQVGIPIKKYLLWKRIIDGINFAARGRDFTTAAFEAGFADGAHMSRTFKTMFGINLSDFFSAKQPMEVVFEQITEVVISNKNQFGGESC